MKDIFNGISYVFKGIRAYYSDTSLWKYGFLPFLGLVIFYFIIFFLCFYFLKGLVFWLVFLSLVLIFVPLTLSLLYELAGGIFFDLLIAKYAEKNSLLPPPQIKGRFLHFIADTVRFNIKSILLMILLIPASLVLPLAGQILVFLYLGNRNGKVWLLPALYFYGKTYETSKAKLKERGLLITSFGTTLIFLLSMPFAALFLLPSLALGGLMLVEENLLEEEKNG